MRDETVVLRQIHPMLVQCGHVSDQAFITSQAFTPTKKDMGKLSVYNGDKFSPDTAFEHYTDELKLESAGVVGVSVFECKSEGRPVVEDNEPFDGHAYIDYTGLSNGDTRKVAKVLRNYAVERGWLYVKKESLP